MGARAHMSPRLMQILPRELSFGYIGRPERASPGEGYPIAHALAQDGFIRTALSAGWDRRSLQFPVAQPGEALAVFLAPCSISPVPTRRHEQGHRAAPPDAELRRARHGHRPGHGEHARLRRRAGDRRLRALGCRLGHRDRARPCGRLGCRADDRPHSGHDRRHPSAPPRRDRRLRGHRADASLLHPQDDRSADGPPPADRVRTLRA